MKKKIYRTIIKLVVLSEEPIPENMSVQSILDECDSGEYIGTTDIGEPTILIGKTAAIAIEKAGSSTEFFNMDSKGNDLDEEDDEEDETKDSAFDSFIDSADLPQ